MQINRDNGRPPAPPQATLHCLLCLLLLLLSIWPEGARIALVNNFRWCFCCPFLSAASSSFSSGDSALPVVITMLPTNHGQWATIIRGEITERTDGTVRVVRKKIKFRKLFNSSWDWDSKRLSRVTNTTDSDRGTWTTFLGRR